jgi:hypothetical protein
MGSRRRNGPLTLAFAGCSGDCRPAILTGVIAGWLMAHLLLGGVAADVFRQVVDGQEVPDCLTTPSS